MLTKLVIERGTSIIRVPKVYSVWAGEEYFEGQKMKMRVLSRNMMLSTKRGTSSLKLSEYPPIGTKPMCKGFVISTARGTATRIL